MKVPTARRTSSDASAHFSPYPPTLPAFAYPPTLASVSPRGAAGHLHGLAPAHGHGHGHDGAALPPPTTTQALAHPPPAPARQRSDSQSANEQQYKVARAISSCTRCRSRKQKCDGKLPACSACERAKVECIGFDAISKTNVSRNLLFSLEQEVATLRAQLAALTGAPGVVDLQRALPRSDLSIDPSLQADFEVPVRSPWDTPGSAFSRRVSDFPFPGPSAPDSPHSPVVGGHSHRHSVSNPMLGAVPGSGSATLTRMVQDAALRTGHASVNPSSILAVTSAGVLGESPSEKSTPADAARDSPVMTPVSVPRAPPSLTSTAGSRAKPRRVFAVPPLPPQAAVERLIAAYVDFVGVTAPIIHIPTLGAQLTRMREGTDVEQSDVFVVMMVLALSTMASSRFVDAPDDLRACSEAFHAEALKHLDAAFEAQSYVGLQAILLLVWYSLLNPEKGSIWFLVGLASRICVDLGFHNEHNAQSESLDDLELDMRRRLFWSTYKMDRLLSQSLGRPPSIPDGYIHVPLPSPLHDVDIVAGTYGATAGDTCSYKAVFLHTVRLRQLQSEILNNTYGVNGGNLPAPEWFDDMRARLDQWLSTAPEPRGTVSTEGYAISYHNSCLLLFRPSRSNPRPDRSALAVVLASSSYIIRIYRRMQMNNRISWLWMTSHFSFMAGLSFLYAFSNLYSLGGGAGVPTLDEAMIDVESCLGVLEYLSPRVASASACHDTLRSVSQAIFDQLSKMARPELEADDAAAGPGRIRGAPISSSRDDPLPNETFPAPLPPVTLPYELSLLDNLFLNPMAPHGKASEYTNGASKPKTPGGGAKPTLALVPGQPQPAAFPSHYDAYGIAAQLAEGAAAGSHAHALAAAAAGAATPATQQTGVDPAFDVFSFLMDDEGALGAGSWDAMDVPADYPLWS